MATEVHRIPKLAADISLDEKQETVLVRGVRHVEARFFRKEQDESIRVLMTADDAGELQFRVYRGDIFHSGGTVAAYTNKEILKQRDKTKKLKAKPASS
ncbi:hypothetical protein KW783_02965 [Candidatus Parcubacteria bacterium]|nr:hypothetical protein [Candidatus Parcubacteria bacterium]